MIMIELLYFDKTVKKGNITDLDKLKDNKIWIDVTNITQEEAELLGKHFNLHHLTTEDLLLQTLFKQLIFN